MAFPKFQTKEVLNKVLNAGEDALNVDLTAGASAIYVDDADWTDDESSHTLVGGLFGSNTITSGDTGPIAVATDGAVHINDGGNTITVDGTVTVSGLLSDGHNVTIDNASDDEVYVRGSGTAGSADTAVLTVQGIASGTAQPVSGTVTANAGSGTLAVSLASVPSHHVTNAGTFVVQSTLSAADGVDIGDVDVASIVPGVAATSLGKAEDAVHGSGDTGVAVLAVRNDVLEALAGTDGDYSVLQVNKTGALNVTETVGHLGAHYENTTGTIDSLKIVAFQFLEDTKFSVLTPATSAYIGNTSSGGKDVPNDEVFPQGMTIFGRWTAFTLVTGGRVIAYLGDW
jgi:hypothetical protein